MITSTKTGNYLATIGIECHVQLKTTTKLFSGVSNDARMADPNTLISHICLGMPGALPVINQKAIEFAARVAFAFGTTPQKFSYFERKHYFYPDLPKGYQITQLHKPIVVGGQVKITVDGQTKIVRINRVQLEEDAGKSTHPKGANYSLVDYNRAGTPLLEIVSEPDIHTPEEAKAYAKELYLLIRYADVSDADMYHGNMRFDVNVSVSKNPKILGTRSETKNLNSFKSVQRAVEYEIHRQIQLLEQGLSVKQETRGWHDDKQKTFSQRTKEEAHDYRYFPDPDLPPIVLDQNTIKEVEKSMPLMPDDWRKRLEGLGLDDQQTEILIDAEAESLDVDYLPLIEQYLHDKQRAKFLANYFVNIEIPFRASSQSSVKMNDSIRAQYLSLIFDLVESNKLSSTNAKLLYQKLLETKSVITDVEQFAKKMNLLQVSDSGELEEILQQVFAENPQAVEDVKNGEDKAIGFLVGQVMKASKGQANPQLVRQLIDKNLNG